MRDIDDARDAEDQRQPGADEEQAGRRGQPVERLKQEGVEVMGAIESSTRREVVDLSESGSSFANRVPLAPAPQ